VDVGATDTTGADAHQDLLGPHFTDFQSFDADIFLGVENTSACLHGNSFA
jgi:hypothetical protein